MGIATILLAVWYRIPITIAWSTPGAAVLAASPAPAGGWATAGDHRDTASTQGALVSGRRTAEAILAT